MPDQQNESKAHHIRSRKKLHSLISTLQNKIDTLELEKADLQQQLEAYIQKFGRPKKYGEEAQHEVQKMLDQGKSIRQIAHALKMSTFTVQKLKKQIADNEKL